MDSIDLLIFSGLLVSWIGIGFYQPRKIHLESTYLFADRKIGWMSLTATLVMTEFNSATLISFSSLGYTAGFWALSLPFIFLCGLVFYALSVAKKWKSFDGTSVAGFFSERYGRNLGICTSLLLIISMLGFSAVYIKSLTLLFQPLFPSVNPWIMSGLMLAIIFCMSLRGGILAIIRTHLVSFIVVLLFFPLAAFIVWKAPAATYELPLSLDQAQEILPFRFIFSLIVLTMFTYILAPWYGQKIFSAKSKKIAYRSVIAAAILIFFLYGSAILATALFRHKGFKSPSSELAFPTLINCCFPKGFKGLAYALLFATTATTLTGVWNAMAAMWIGDFMKPSTATEGCFRSIVATSIFALISFILSNTLIDKVFEKMILANIPIAALSFGLLAGFYWKSVSYKGVLISIMMGCFCGIGAYCLFGEERCYTWYWAAYGIPLIFISGFVGSLIFKDRCLRSA
ncbi:MAG: hypothetical protein WAM28_04110 [Chlamydiales bacterium]